MAATSIGKKVEKLVQDNNKAEDIGAAVEQMFFEEKKSENDIKFWLQQYPRGKWDSGADFTTQWDLFVKYIAFSGIKEEDAIKYVTPILPTKFLQAWIQKSDTIKTLADAKTALMEIAGLAKNNFVAETLYRERCQKPNEPVSEFYRELHALFIQANYDEKAGGRAALASDFESKLNNRLRWAVMRRKTGDPTKDGDPKEILRRAQEEEEILRQQDREMSGRNEMAVMSVQNIQAKTNECYRCGKIGHMKKDCKSKVSKGCYICGDLNHFKRDCPKKNQGNGQRTFRTGANRSFIPRK